MSYNFEKFTAVGGKFVIGITLAKPGGLSMTSGLYNKYGVSKYTTADLFYDGDEKAIAIKFYEGNEGNFNIKHREGGKGGYISAISFIKMNGLEEYLGTRFEPKAYDDSRVGNVLVIDLV